MRKHFLILMLLSLLPLAGWAVTEDVTFVQAGGAAITEAFKTYDATEKALPKPSKIGTDDITAYIAWTRWYKAASDGAKTGDPIDNLKDAGKYVCEFEVNYGNHMGEHSGVFEIKKCPLTVTAGDLTGTNALAFGDAFSGENVTVTFAGWPTAITSDPQAETKINNLKASFGTVTIATDGYVPFTTAVGTHNDMIVPVITGLTSANYDFTAVHGDLEIAAKDISGNANALNVTIANIFYTSTNAEPTFEVYDAANPTKKLEKGTDFTVTYYSDAACTTQITTIGAGETGLMHKGNYYVKIEGNGNYTGTFEPSQVLTYKVQPELLIVTMKSATLPYKAEAYDLSETEFYTVTGLCANDVIEGYNITLRDKANATATTLTDVAGTEITNVAFNGSYPIKANSFSPKFTTASKQQAGDYTVQFSTTAVTIAPAPLKFIFKELTKHEDETAAIKAGIQPADAAEALTYMTVDATKKVLGTDAIDKYPKFKATQNAAGKWIIDFVTPNTLKVKNGTTDITRNYAPESETAELIIIADQGVLYVIPTNEVYGAVTGEGYVKVTVTGGAAADNEALAALLNNNKVTVKPYLNTADDTDPKNGKLLDKTTNIEYPNAGVYAVAYDEEVQTSEEWLALAANYDINLTGRPDYEITKAPIKVTLKEQAIYASEDEAALVVDENTVELDSPVNGDKLKDLYKEMTVGGALAFVGATLSAQDDPFEGEITLNGGFKFANYEITEVTNGDLYVSAEATLNLIERTDGAVVTALEGKNHHKADVAITLKRDGNIENATETAWKGTWDAKQWNAMVLPFDVTLKELSTQLGYAIVNVVNPEKTTENNVQFQLWMDVIPANTPFLVKTTDAIEDGKVLSFQDKTIKYVEAPSVDAGNGYTFEANYAGQTITKDESYMRFLTGNRAKWAQIGATSAYEWFATEFAAFVNLTPAAEGREVTFTMEEMDGSTTTIGSVKVDNAIKNGNAAAEGWYNLNGMKLQSAPTEKGVYIKDGKKFVIK